MTFAIYVAVSVGTLAVLLGVCLAIVVLFFPSHLRFTIAETQAAAELLLLSGIALLVWVMVWKQL